MKRNTKMAFALFCFLLAALLVFGGCSSALTSQAGSSTQEPQSQASSEVGAESSETGESTPTGEMTPLTILSSGWVNIPFDEPDDPFRLYLQENYGLDVTVLSYAAADFEQQLSVAMASDAKPDIVHASRLVLDNYYTQGSLLDDWTPYLESMPRIKAHMEQDDLLFQMAHDAEGHLKFVFANPDVTQWCLKVRRDWLNQWASENGKPEGYDIPNSEELLAFARWIKETQNPDQNNLSVYAFTSSGDGTAIGTSIEWTQGIFGHTINGLGNAAAMGFYIDEDGKVSHPVLDGSYAQWLDFMKTIYEEKLINPDWFTTDWGNKGLQLYEGKAAFDWYPGVIVSETLFQNLDKTEYDRGQATYDWWDNMDVPANEGNPYQGIATPSNFGHTWSVSYEASLDEEKMGKICSLLNDVAMTYNESAEDQTYFGRSETYDALRWGVRVLEDHTYQPVENSKLVMCDTWPNKSEGASTYREDHNGAWDWGSWFSCNNDGVIQATDIQPDVLKFSEKVGMLNDTTGLKSYFVPGNLLEYDTAKLQAMFDSFVQYTYQYMTGASTMSVEEYQQYWRTQLEGDLILAAAEEQYRALGLMD